MTRLLTATAIAVTVALAAAPAAAQDNEMSFFISSAGSGNGANLGGLAGADAHCQMLATAVGAGDRTWQAYLSTDGQGGVNGRDRIGSGPWYNAAGAMVAESVDALHSDAANINMEAGLDENGNMINGEEMPNRHDILTGSDVNGMALEGQTCGNWTSSGEGTAMLGHYDRLARGTPGSPWNEAHASRSCSQEDLVATGGAGLIYCFAID
jgi:hypothetical protein